MPRLSERKFTAVVYAIVFTIALFLVLPSLLYYWFLDDLFVVRPYSNQELLAGFTGNWDISGLVTPSWRPLTRVFFHVQALLFGETIELYRLFNTALFALHITLLLVIARELKLSRMTVLAAGVIFVCTKNTWWMTAWPTDGLRNFMGILGSLAIYLLIQHLKRPARWKFALALLCYALALLTREEILFYAAVIPAVAFVYLVQRDDLIAQPRRWISVTDLRTVVIYGLIAGMITAIYWLVRGYVVPRSSVTLVFDGFLFQVVAVLFPHLPAPSLLASAALIVLVWVVLILMLRAIDRRKRLLALFWLGCVLLACTPGLNSWRANNLLLAIGFFALFLATILVSFAQRSRLAAWSCALLILGFAGGSAYMHRLAQESIHPYSLYYISASQSYAWNGQYSAAVPPERVDRLRAEYQSLGINSEQDFQRIYPQIAQGVVEAGLDHPDGNHPFQPWYPTFFHPW